MRTDAVTPRLGAGNRGALETLRETARHVRTDALTYLRIGLAAMTPGLTLQALAMSRMQAATHVREIQATSLGDVSGGGIDLIRFPYLIIATMVAVVGMLIAQGAMTHVTSEKLAGRSPGLRESLAVGFRCLSALFAQHVVVSLLVVAGLLLLVLPGILAMLAYFLVYGVAGPAVVIEGISAIDGLDRSADLTRGRRFEIALSFVPIACVLAALAFCSLEATVAASHAFQAVFGHGSYAGALFATLVGVVPAAAYVSVATTYWVVVYARARRDEAPSSVTSPSRAFA